METVNKNVYTLNGVYRNGEFVNWNILTFTAMSNNDQESFKIFNIVNYIRSETFETVLIISRNQTLLPLAAAKGKPLLCE